MKWLSAILLAALLVACGEDNIYEMPFMLTGDAPYAGSVAAADDTLRVLLIGNSYAQDATDSYLDSLLDECGVTYVIGRLHYQSCSLAMHLDHAVHGSHVYDYLLITPDGRTAIENVSMPDVAASQPWDVVSLQQVSERSGIFSSYARALPRLIEELRAILPADTRMALHQTWAYPVYNTSSDFDTYRRDQENMYAMIADATERAVAQFDLQLLVPSGTAVQNARTSPLLTADGADLCRDQYHLDLYKGRYTVACTWAETLTGVDALRLNYRPATVSEEEASACRQAAHAAILEPYRVTPLQ